MATIQDTAQYGIPSIAVERKDPDRDFLLSLSTRSATNSINGSYYFLFSVPIKIDINKFCRIKLEQATIPFTFYNCGVNNNILIINENGVNRTIIIEEGFYDQYDLMVQLLLQLNTGTIVYAMSFSPTKAKYTFSTVTLNTTVIFNVSGTTADELLGFVEGNTSIMTNLIPLISPNVINLTYTNSLRIFSNLTSNSTLTSQTGATSTQMAFIPINANTGDVIFYTNEQSEHKIFYSSRSIDSITINLVDDHGFNIDLNGSHFEVTILIEVISY